ncbi:Thiamin-phosphate pyrophosphorylase [hydrothermal vent metagenome]|uniref:thiamine phosphate synthase n=1 Tax=hydrothermal vent metagenome TaxID=652676 RepID=A0A3B0XAH1_9ZZZZ
MPIEHFAPMAEAALCAGASILQYRDKSANTDKRLEQAKNLKKLCLKYNATFIINDDISLAKEVNADGVHLGRNDPPVKEAREQLGPDKIIGISCYNQLSLAIEAIQQDADYIAFGSFFNSSIKPDAPVASANLIAELKQTSNIPICCIGGINIDNCTPLLSSGADMLAVISEVFSSTDEKHIQHRCKQFSLLF